MPSPQRHSGARMLIVGQLPVVVVVVVEDAAEVVAAAAVVVAPAEAVVAAVVVVAAAVVEVELLSESTGHTQMKQEPTGSHWPRSHRQGKSGGQLLGSVVSVVSVVSCAAAKGGHSASNSSRPTHTPRRSSLFVEDDDDDDEDRIVADVGAILEEGKLGKGLVAGEPRVVDQARSGSRRSTACWASKSLSLPLPLPLPYSTPLCRAAGCVKKCRECVCGRWLPANVTGGAAAIPLFGVRFS